MNGARHEVPDTESAESATHVVSERLTPEQRLQQLLPDDGASAPTASDGVGDDLNLRSAVGGGLAWNGLLVVVVQITRTISGVILVRLLSPGDFGLAGMAMLFSGFVLIFADLGLGSALVQRRAITEEDKSTVFWTTVGMGALFTLGGIALSAPLATFFHQPRVKDLFMVLSLCYVIGSFGMTQASLIHRAMAFRSISLRLIIASIGGCTTAVIVAFAGGGAWSLIAQELAVTIISTAFLWLSCDWRPSFRYSRMSLKSLGGFGFHVAGSNLLSFLQGNGDNILIGRYLGSAPLGLYSVSYNVILVPITRLFGPVQETLFPALSRIQEDTARVARIWLQAVRGTAAVILPVILGLLIVTPDFVDVILGERWHATIPVIRILSVVTLTTAFSGGGGRTLLALGRSRIVFLFAVANTAVILPAFAVGLRWGIVGVAALYAIVTIPLQAGLVAVVSRVLHIPLSVLARNVASVAGAAGLMAVVCWLCRMGLIQLGAPATLRLALVVLVGVGIYLPLMAWRSPDVVRELRRLRSSSSMADQTDQERNHHLPPESGGLTW